VSQLSGISGITLSSWESNIERNLRKQGQQQPQQSPAGTQLEGEIINEEVSDNFCSFSCTDLPPFLPSITGYTRADSRSQQPRH
jgi:hypothetical protein